MWNLGPHPMRRFYTTMTSAYQYLKVQPHGKVAVVHLNRPESLNALSSGLFKELNGALHSLDQDPAIMAIVLTGDEKAFAAGADIKEMSERTLSKNILEDFLGDWSFVSRLRKPILAAVNGFAVIPSTSPKCMGMDLSKTI